MGLKLHERHTWAPWWRRKRVPSRRAATPRQSSKCGSEPTQDPPTACSNYVLVQCEETSFPRIPRLDGRGGRHLRAHQHVCKAHILHATPSPRPANAKLQHHTVLVAKPKDVAQSNTGSCSQLQGSMAVSRQAGAPCADLPPGMCTTDSHTTFQLMDMPGTASCRAAPCIPCNCV